ncbi:hypothetical protein CR513_28317, partial [Mucuna pruriens]
QSLEERPQVVEGGSRYGLKAVDICLVLDVGLPIDFKTLEFDKYKGSSCPRVHLAMYCRKMAAHIHDDKYVSLEWGCIKAWRDLAEAFLKQYKYNEDMALDRSRLQGTFKKEQEGFMEYA